MASARSCGGRIRTYDLQVMSLTSYQAAPPRDKGLRLPAGVPCARIIRGNYWSCSGRLKGIGVMSTLAPIPTVSYKKITSAERIRMQP